MKCVTSQFSEPQRFQIWPEIKLTKPHIDIVVERDKQKCFYQ